MNNHSKLGSYLLFPPAILWLLVVLFMIDNTLAQYFFSSINLQVMDFIFLIAGLVFPAAALVVGIRGVLIRQQKAYNYGIIAVSTVMLTLMVLIVFVF